MSCDRVLGSKSYHALQPELLLHIVQQVAGALRGLT